MRISQISQAGLWARIAESTSKAQAPCGRRAAALFRIAHYVHVRVMLTGMVRGLAGGAAALQ